MVPRGRFKKLDGIVVRTLKVSLGLPKNAPTQGVLAECGIPSLWYLRRSYLIQLAEARECQRDLGVRGKVTAFDHALKSMLKDWLSETSSG